MAEKKESQWCVIKFRRIGRTGNVTTPEPSSGIAWFDARNIARGYAGKQSAKSRKFVYRVFPMKRGPRA